MQEDLADQRRRRQELASERELDELLEVTNARRRAKGLPERTPEQAREEFGAGGASGPGLARPPGTGPTDGPLWPAA